MGDPGRSNDPFGIVGTMYNHDKHKIQFKLAKQIINQPYSVAAQFLIKMKKQIKPNFIGIETNNRGKRVLALYRTKYKMTWLQGVATSANLTEQTRQKGFTMDKPFMVKWFKTQMEEGLFEWPDDPTPDMQVLIDQVPQIVSIRTAGGQTSYKAQRGRHDDLFMAALHCCNFIRLFIEQQERLK